jgi:uncharacterized delta-60 repeat protein
VIKSPGLFRYGYFIYWIFVNDKERTVKFESFQSAAFAAIMSLCLATSALAAPGDIVTSYGQQGIVHTPSGDLVVGIESVGSDGVLVGGSGHNPYRARFSQLLSSGSDDHSFGTNGHTEIDVPSLLGLQNFSLMDFTHTAAQKTVFVGYSLGPVGGDGAVVRLNSNGTLDTSFAGGVGAVQLRSLPGLGASGNLIPRRIAADSAGRILVLSRDLYSINLLRLLPSGALDTSFGSVGGVPGVVQQSLSGGQYAHMPVDVNVDASGNITIAAWMTTNPMTMAVARFSANGQPLTGFANNGVLTVNMPNGVELTALAQDTAGRHLLLLSDCSLQRYTSAGVLDTGFGVAGTALVPAPASGSYACQGITLRPTDAPILSGSYQTASNSNELLLARFDNNGQLVTGFDGDGVLLVGQPPFIGSVDTYGYAFSALHSNGFIRTAVRERPGLHNFAVAAVEDSALNVVPRPANLGQRSFTPANTWVSSNMMQVQDLTAGARVMITVDNGEYSVNGAAYTSAPGQVSNGNLVVLRHWSANCRNCVTQSALRIGGVLNAKNARRMGGEQVYGFVSSTGGLKATPIEPEPLPLRLAP